MDTRRNSEVYIRLSDGEEDVVDDDCERLRTLHDEILEVKAIRSYL